MIFFITDSHFFNNRWLPVFLVSLSCFCLFSNQAISARAFPASGENAFFSLLTASPGTEVWSYFGHTGIRYNDPNEKIDIVFNYGLFDFSSQSFLWRFVTGKTDYMVGTCSYFDFLLEYQLENRAVTEQILNLNAKEKTALWHALLTNIQPENRIYRYNFFFRNCSTQPRDVIVQAIRGTIDYQWAGFFNSLREEVHHYTNSYPWVQFGIDFALGAEADNQSSLDHQQFAPEVLMESFSKAIILGDSLNSRPLVLETRYPATIDQELMESKGFSIGPLSVMWFLFVMMALLTFFELKYGKPYHLLDAFFFTFVGLVGVVIGFLMFFSEHPTTDINYLLLWAHPLHLLYAIALIIPAFRKKGAFQYKAINLPFQVMAMAGVFFLPQALHPAMYPLLFSLMLRSMSGFWMLKNKQTHE